MNDLLRILSTAAALLLLLVLPSCTSPAERLDRDDPAGELAEQLRALEDARSRGRAGDLARVEIERLALKYPQHVPTLLTAATLALEARETDKARRFLEAVLRLRPVHPEAAVLRARIAMEEGALGFAVALLERQIRYTPDSAPLHETLGCARYLEGDLKAARESLDQAAALGAPAWRVAYHQGLVAEALGEPAEAERCYASVLEENPDFAPAHSRLRALRAR